jgi:prostaglandin-E synthase 1
MLLSSGNPVFTVYVISTLVLVLHLLFLWIWSGKVRSQLRVVLNTEDAKRAGTTLGDAEPPEIARIVRVYNNAAAATYAFLIIALVFVAMGGGMLFAEITFGLFVAARLLYAVVYLAGVQPWRSIFYTTGLLTTVALMGEIVHLLSRR